MHAGGGNSLHMRNVVVCAKLEIYKNKKQSDAF